MKTINYIFPLCLLMTACIELDNSGGGNDKKDEPSTTEGEISQAQEFITLTDGTGFNLTFNRLETTHGDTAVNNTLAETTLPIDTHMTTIANADDGSHTYHLSKPDGFHYDRMIVINSPTPKLYRLYLYDNEEFRLSIPIVSGEIFTEAPSLYKSARISVTGEDLSEYTISYARVNRNMFNLQPTEYVANIEVNNYFDTCSGTATVSSVKPGYEYSAERFKNDPTQFVHFFSGKSYPREGQHIIDFQNETIRRTYAISTQIENVSFSDRHLSFELNPAYDDIEESSKYSCFLRSELGKTIGYSCRHRLTYKAEKTAYFGTIQEECSTETLSNEKPDVLIDFEA